ncbi:hypothetical protein, partial [Salmonella enterica]|uniref:hypothetical protein n=1 Tax=Salmonella enterica TaxID=28901 RepID=UPI0032B33655
GIEDSFASGHRRLLHRDDWHGDVSEAAVPAELRGQPAGSAAAHRNDMPPDMAQKIMDIDEGRAPPHLTPSAANVDKKARGFEEG